MSLLRFEEQVEVFEQNTTSRSGIGSGIVSDVILDDERVWDMFWAQISQSTSIDYSSVISELQKFAVKDISVDSVMMISQEMHNLLKQRELSDGTCVTTQFTQSEVFQLQKCGLIGNSVEIWKEYMFTYMTATFKSQRQPLNGVSSLTLWNIVLYIFLNNPRMRWSQEQQCLVDSVRHDSIDSVNDQRDQLESRVILMHGRYTELVCWCKETLEQIMSSVDYTKYLETSTGVATCAPKEWLFYKAVYSNLTSYLVSCVRVRCNECVLNEDSVWIDAIQWLRKHPYASLLDTGMYNCIFKCVAETVVESVLQSIGKVDDPWGFTEIGGVLLSDIYLSTVMFPNYAQSLRTRTLQWFSQAVGSWDVPLPALQNYYRDILNFSVVFDPHGSFARACINMLKQAIPAYRDGMIVLATYILNTKWLGEFLHPFPDSLHDTLQAIFHTQSTCETATGLKETGYEYKTLDPLNRYLYATQFDIIKVYLVTEEASAHQWLQLLPIDLSIYTSQQKYKISSARKSVKERNIVTLTSLPLLIQQADVLSTLPDDEKVCVTINTVSWAPESRLGGEDKTVTLAKPRLNLAMAVLEPVPKPNLAGNQQNKAQKLREELVDADVLPLQRQPALLLVYISGNSDLLTDAIVQVQTQRAQLHYINDVTPLQVHQQYLISILGEACLSPAAVVLHDIQQSEQMKQTVQTRAKEDQAALVQFHAFQAKTIKSASASTIPTLILARQPQVQNVLLISADMWVSEWHALCLGQNTQWVREQLDYVLKRTFHAKKIFPTLPQVNTIAISPEEAGKLEETSDKKTSAYNVNLQCYEYQSKSAISAHMYYDTSMLLSKSNTNILSIQGEPLRLPKSVAQAMQEYTQIYNSLAKPRTLTFVPTEGIVSLDIEIEGTTKTFFTTPICAAVVSCFGDEYGLVQPQMTIAQVAQITQLPTEQARDAIRFWCIHGVLQYIGSSLYQATG